MSRTFLTIIKCIAASAIMGVIVHFVFVALEVFYSFRSFYELLALLFSVAVGMGIYVVLLHLFRVKEIRWLENTIRNQIHQYRQS